MGSTGCCGVNIKTCAKIVCILGIIFALISILPSVLLLWYLPMNILLVITLILALIGIYKEKSGLLIPALIILALYLIINFLTFIGFVFLLIFIPEKTIKSHVDKGYSQEEAENALQLTFLVSALIFLILTIYTIFTFIVLLKARKHFNQNKKTTDYGRYETKGVHGPPAYPPSYAIPVPMHFPDFHGGYDNPAHIDAHEYEAHAYPYEYKTKALKY